MPITLGCPSCGKRFRARDESAGKRVRCPFCQAAVPVPSAAEASTAGAPTEVVGGSPGSSVGPPSGSRSGSTTRSAGEPALFDVAGAPHRPAPTARGGGTPAGRAAGDTGPVTPADWGAAGAAGAPAVEAAPAPAGAIRPELDEDEDDRKGKGKGRRSRPAKTPQELAAAAWSKVSAGLFWVLFALFWLALIGFVPFGKMVYERSAGPLPKGPGWVQVSGYVNTNDPGAIQLSKTEEINLLAYGVPVLLGGLALVLGRVTCGAVPRSSGAKGLFAFSGLFALLALAAYATMLVCDKVGYGDVYRYSRLGSVVAVALSEFWFLIALVAVAATVKRPRGVRAVGAFALVLGLAAIVLTAGPDLYREYGPDLGVPRNPDPDWLLYEQAARMLGWLVLVGTYWRAVRAVRSAVRDHIDALEEGTATA